MPTLDSFFSSVKLPAMSEVAHALIKTLNDENASVSTVTAIIAKDPSLTAKLLRLANSAQFGLPRGVGSLDDAITMVGMSKVRTLCLGACLADSFPVIPGLDRKEFWRSSMACAGYSQWLASSLGVDAQVAWLTGMMLRLGELLIAQADPQSLAEIEKLPHLPGGRWEREQRITGFSEGQITAELARRWNFPMAMVQALQSSADPLSAPSFSRLGAIIHLAELIAEHEMPDTDVVDALPQDVIKALLLDVGWMRAKFPKADSFVDVSGM
jgi:HD-like signal output (HDOD) protein